MRRCGNLAAIPLALAAALYLAGCGGGGEVKKDSDEHDHAHEHGPHGGALVELGTDEKFHAEWATGADGMVTVWILDGSGEKEVPIEAEKVTIDTKDAQGSQTFELAAVNRTTGDKPTAFQFEIGGGDGKELQGVLETLGESVTATLKVDVNGDMREGKIEKHTHEH